MAAPPHAGFKCTLKIGVSPNEKIVGIARDVEIGGTRGTIDVTSRVNQGWKENIAGLAEWDAKVEMLWVFDDEALVLLETAFLDGTAVHCQFEDENAKGYKGDALVTDFRRGEALEDAVTCSVTLTGASKLEKLP